MIAENVTAQVVIAADSVLLIDFATVADDADDVLDTCLVIPR